MKTIEVKDKNGEHLAWTTKYNLFEKYFVNPLAERIVEIIKPQLTRHLVKEMAWEVFSVIGLESLEEVLKESKSKNKSRDNKYQSLAQVYSERLRSLSLERVKKLEETIRGI